MTRDELLAAKLLSAHRAENPRSRAPGIIAWGRNTSACKSHRCVICGEEGPTFSARWPETRRSSDWRLAHEAAHLEAALAAHVAALPVERRVARDAEDEGRHDVALAIRLQEACS